MIHDVREVTQHAVYSYEVSMYSGLSIRGTREQALVALQSIKHNLQTDIAFYDYSLHEMVRKKSDIETVYENEPFTQEEDARKIAEKRLRGKEITKELGLQSEKQ